MNLKKIAVCLTLLMVLGLSACVQEDQSQVDQVTDEGTVALETGPDSELDQADDQVDVEQEEQENEVADIEDDVISEEETEPEPPVEEKSVVKVLESDFETTIGDWTPRIGNEVLAIADYAHEGIGSLMVSERDKAYCGVKIDLLPLVEDLQTYDVQAFVSHLSDSEEEIHMTMERTKDGETTYSRVASSPVQSGQWVELSTAYTTMVGEGVTALYLYFETSTPDLVFYIDDVTMSHEVLEVPIGVETHLPSLWEAYQDYFTLGAAINPSVIENPMASQLVLKHFSSITAGNAMKPDAILDRNNRGQVSFNRSDQFAEFAESNGIGLRGHTLVWHSQTPDWFFKEDYSDTGDLVDRETMLERMEWYIGQVAGAYKDSNLYTWDVVNEAIDTNGADNMRQSYWYQTIGPDFVEKAFEFARKYTQGTDITLIYNDYSVVSNRKKRQAIFDMVKGLKEKDLIDGVGLQSHVTLYSPSADAFAETIELFASIGLEVQITELDVSVYSSDDQYQAEVTEDQLSKQYNRYRDILQVCVAHSDVVTNVTFWGLTDDDSWLNNFPVKNRPNWPLLFDRYYHAKPAYDGVLDAASDEAGQLDLPLKTVFEPYFLMGAAINGYNLQTAAYNHEDMAHILKSEFNSTTLSNLMKPDYLLDQEASINSPDGMPVCYYDNIIPGLAFCQDNGIRMRGHTLVWHNQTPEWFFHEGYDVDQPLVDAGTMSLRLESYIQQVMTFCQETYPGVIYCWDVVNEAIAENGSWRTKDSLWYEIMEETYIEKAFTYARLYADEGVKLIYNDYNVFNPDKRYGILMMAFDLKSKGLIDGLGLQPTVGLYDPDLNSDATASSFKKTLEVFSALDLDIQITELGFKMNETPTEALLQQQADRYNEMMTLLLEMDDENGGPSHITSVTVFGVADDYPLYDNYESNIYLWDGNCQKKPAYYSYLQAGLDWP